MQLVDGCSAPIRLIDDSIPEAVLPSSVPITKSLVKLAQVEKAAELSLVRWL